MNLNLVGQRILITGSSRGIGRAIAEEFLAEGCRVVITGRHIAGVDATCKALTQAYGEASVMPFVGDLGNEQVCVTLKDKLENQWQGLDHLVCNIGSGRSVAPLQEDRSEWQRMLDINLLNASGCVHTMQDLLVESAQVFDRMASIVFVSSICGVEALGCPVAYASAKAALQAYAKNITRPLAELGVRVNCVSPGNIVFSGSTWEQKLEQDAEGVQDMLNRDVPLKRLGRPEEIASSVVFLASEKASFVTGAHWIIDGGQTRGL